jgi:hypothetical protein
MFKLSNKSCRRCGSNAHQTERCPNTAAARAEDEQVRAAAQKEAAAAKRAAARAAKQQRKRAAQAVMAAAYAAIAAVQQVPATPGATANSSWAVVADLCGTCGLPPRRCMCI